MALECAYGRLLTASSKMVVKYYVELFPCNGQPTTTPIKGQLGMCALHLMSMTLHLQVSHMRPVLK